MYTFKEKFPINPEPNPKLLSAFHLYWAKCLDHDLLLNLEKIIDSVLLTDAKIGTPDSSSKVDKIRQAKLGWIYQNNNEDMYAKIIDFLIRVNYHNFGFDIDRAEAIQYSVYEDQGHYNYHHDMHFSQSLHIRKLSASFCLSSVNDYTGGEIELIHYGDYEQNFVSYKMDLGDAVFFPSWVTHRVKPVTSGCRRSLVVWCSGPKFK